MSLLAVVALGLPSIIVALGCWLGYQLLQQNGRILLRLEALEEQLAQLLPPELAGLPLGEAAPDFELPNLAGGRTAISQFRGQRVLLIFFNPQCVFCRELGPQLAALAADGDEGRPVLLVVTTGDAEENRTFVREQEIRCVVLLQEHMEVASKYQAEGTPTGYLIDGEGRIASELAVGAQALLALATALQATPTDRVAHAPAPHGDGHQFHRGERLLAISRINRSGLKTGTPAPAFRLPHLDGGEVSLEDYRGRRVLLVFSDPECGPCDELAPRLERLRRRTSDVEVLMVSRRDAAANREKARRLGLTFPVVLQRHWEVSRLYATFATPVGYLIDEQGVIATDMAVGVEPILALLSDAGASLWEGGDVRTQS
jgi:peroxiredoxin